MTEPILERLSSGWATKIAGLVVGKSLQLLDDRALHAFKTTMFSDHPGMIRQFDQQGMLVS